MTRRLLSKYCLHETKYETEEINYNGTQFCPFYLTFDLIR